jgi:hypothetical protein
METIKHLEVCYTCFFFISIYLNSITDFFHFLLKKKDSQKENICVHRYINGKIRLVETIPGMGEGEIKEDDGDSRCHLR